MTLLKQAARWALLPACILLAYCSPSRKTPAPPPVAATAGTPALVVPERPQKAHTDAFLEKLLAQYPRYFSDVVKDPDSFGVQIIYTQIDRASNGSPAFRNYYFNVNASNYFYPATTVELPVAMLALQRLNEQRTPGLDRNSTMLTDSGWQGQSIVLNDPTSADGRPSVAQYIKRLFLTGDEAAFDRLYELLGQDYINTRLQAMGYKDAEIRHRLDTAFTEEENRHTNPVRFLDAFGRTLWAQPAQAGTIAWQQRHDSIGKARYYGRELAQAPLDCSNKNRLSLPDLHNLLRSIVFPNSVPPGQRFNISPDDYNFVYRCLSELPGETRFPGYDTAEVWDYYGRYLLMGAAKGPGQKGIRIFNKTGRAYGNLVDVAYIVDLDRNVEFMLSAVINYSPGMVRSSSQYDYEQVGLPFMKHLGEVVYQYELQRRRNNPPDLSAFRLTYDK